MAATRLSAKLLGVMVMRAAVHGVGAWIPSDTRTNDWWPKEIVDEWRSRQHAANTETPDAARSLSPEEALVVAAIAQLGDDPFRGSKVRHVMPHDMMSSTAEAYAGKDALERAGVDPRDVDVLISQTTNPDFLHHTNAYAVHEHLGLRHECLAFSHDGICNSFHIQLAMAASFIQSGAARFVLTIQASDIVRFQRRESPMSTVLGDGVTAVVFGPASNDRGVVAQAHVTDGATFGSIVSGLPGRRWFDDGPVMSYVNDGQKTQQMLLETAVHAKRTIANALKNAGVSPEAVDFFACHQGTAWLQSVAKDVAGLSSARTVEPFPSYASLMGANIPLTFWLGEQSGLLRDGDTVVTFSGAAGSASSAAVLYWGRG